MCLLSQFHILKEIICILNIPYKATLEFQSSKLTLSDVYGRWTAMTLHLNAYEKKINFKTGLATKLKNSLHKRKDVLFENPIMSAAIFLDPRYHNVIARDIEKCKEAKDILMKIWNQNIILNTNVQNLNINNVHESSASDDFFIEFNEVEEMNAFLGRHTAYPQTQNNNEKNDIEVMIDLFNPPSMEMNQSVLKFWKSVKDDDNYKDLYNLAMVVFTVPPTEVQVERDFSSLDHVFTKRRCRLTEERLHDILLLHLNKDLFYAVNENDLNNLIDRITK